MILWLCRSSHSRLHWSIQPRRSDTLAPDHLHTPNYCRSSGRTHLHTASWNDALPNLPAPASWLRHRAAGSAPDWPSPFPPDSGTTLSGADADNPTPHPSAPQDPAYFARHSTSDSVADESSQYDVGFPRETDLDRLHSLHLSSCQLNIPLN